MKKLALRFLAVMAVAITTAVSALGQNGFAYQAVIRDANGELVTNKQVEVKFTLKHDGASCYSETQTVTTNEYGNIQVVVGNGVKVDGDFASVPWNTFDIKMEVAVNVDGKGEVVLGEVPVQGAPYAMYAQKAGGITSKNANTKDGGALFAVNDANGNPVFAVFDDGIVVYVDDNADGGAKAKRSGFVVTGRAATKGETATEYFSVTTEGTQIYVDNNPSKAKRSGFVVTGRAATKDGEAADYLTIDGKGTTVYVDDDSSKAKRSGFVVTGRAATKDGSEPQYFVATADGTTVYVDDTSSDKAKRSGFVVTGRAATKDGSEADYLAVDGSGTQVYIDGADVEDKAKRSGFVVTGRAATKAEEDTLFAIEGGFTRVYVDDNPDGEADKAKRSGFVVTGRAATKDNTNIFNVNGEGEVAILTEEFSVTETAAVEADTSSNQQSGEGTSTQEPAEQKQKSLFTISGGNVQVGTEMVMMGDVTKQIEADTINVDSVDAEFPQIAKIIDRADTVSCSAYKPFVYGNDSDSAGYALLGIYMKGNLAKITATDARRNTILLLDANGNVTKYQKNATVAVLMPEGDTQIYIRPLKATSQTINFGLMKKNSTEPYQYVKIEAEVEAQAGVPYKVITSSTEGGNVVVDGTVAHGDRPSFEAVPKTGYKFVRWSDGSTRAKRTFTIVDDFELSAEFERMSYVLTVKSDDERFGTVSGEGTYLHGDTAMVEATPATGYYFNNWSGVELSDDQLKNPSLALEVTAKLKLIAHFGIMQYTITFDTDGGSEVAAITQDYNTRIEAPADPQKEGFRFRGWSMAIPERMPAEDLTIKAIWGINKYFITIDAVNGQTADTLMFDFGEIVDASLGEPEREGYTFQGWDATLPETMPAQDLVITAQWQLNKHNIVYVIDGREIETVEAYYNSAIEPIQAPIMEGYKFNGWQNVPETMPDSSITISGSYTAIEYGILFMNDGDTLQSTKVGYGQTPKYTGNEPARKADTLYTYEFIGWTPDIYAAESEQVYTAVFDTILRRYTILFVSEGDTLTSKGFAYGQMPEYVGQTPEKKATAKFSYSFIGWVPTVVKVIADQTYTAAFDSTLNKYEIVFVSNESELQKDTLAYGQTPKYTGDEPTRKPNEQYTFKFYDWEPKIAEVTGDQVYTAVFDSIGIDYEILFMNGSDTLQVDTLAYGETPKYTGDEPTRESNKVYTYTFIGWEPEVTSVRTNQTYTAVFDSAYVNYVVKFSGTGGKVLYYNDEAHYGDTIVAPDTDSVGYEFKGWNPAIPTPANVTEDFGTTGRWAAKTNTEYTVNIFLQNFEGKYDTDYPTESITLTGTTDTKTNYQPADTTGFTLDTLKQTVISGNGQAAVYVYYKRNSHQLTWDANEGTFDNVGETITDSCYYGASIECPKSKPTRDGYDFDTDSWSKNVPATMPDNDLTIKAQWILQEYDINYYDIEDSDFDDSKTTYNITETFSIANPTKTGSVFDGWTGTFWETATKSITISGKTGPIDLVANWSESSVKYTVTHHFEKVNGEYDSIVEEFAGRDGDETKAVAKDSTGFAAQDFSQLTIALNNTTNVDIYYNRISYKLIFKGNGGWFGYQVESTYVDTKFGTALSATEAQPTRDGYTFLGWPDLSGRTMPAKDTIIYAEWEANTNTAYKVNTWLQDTLCNDYTLYLEGEEFTGTTDAAISFEFNINGFTQKPFGEVKIAGDGKTVIDVYYDRLRYKATWKVNDTVYAETEKPYDSRIQLPDEPKSAGREFIAWVDDNDAEFSAEELMPFGGKTFYALFDTLYYSVTLPEGMEIISSSVAPNDEKYKYTSKVTFKVADGYVISGYVTANGEQLYEVDGVYELTIPAEDVTISAELTKLHTVRFFALGGEFADGTNMKTVVVPHNSTISDVDSLKPIWDDHTMMCWLYYIDGNQNLEEYKFSNPITQDTLISANWAMTTIYVAQSGSAEGDGTSARPYATIANAVQTIKAHGLTNLDFTIRVSDTIKQNIVIDSTLNDTINSLTIVGVGRQLVTLPDTAYYRPAGTLTTADGVYNRVLTVATTVPVTLRNINITGANTESTYDNGAGIYVDTCATVTIDDSTYVCGNSANDEWGSGGGVAVYGKLVMVGGSIMNNRSYYGGGVYVDPQATFEMRGGSIDGNDAGIGGGVLVRGRFAMTGGVISNNLGSTGNGGAVYVDGYIGWFGMGDSAYIPEGVENNGYILTGSRYNDVYLADNIDYFETRYITILSNLTAKVPVASITSGAYGTSEAYKYFAGDSIDGVENTTLLEANYDKFAVIPRIGDKTYHYVIKPTGYLQQIVPVSFYKSWGGVAPKLYGEPQTLIFGEQLTKPATDPDSTNYRFLGWYQITFSNKPGVYNISATPFEFPYTITSDDGEINLVAKWERLPIVCYVSDDGSDSNEGTASKPFRNLLRAFQYIDENGGEDVDCTIKIIGMHTETLPISIGSTDTIYHAKGYARRANSITITGATNEVDANGDPVNGINGNRGQYNQGVALTLNISNSFVNGQILIKKLKITGGYNTNTSAGYGGGLLVGMSGSDFAGVILGDSLLITGNTANMGGGVYCYNTRFEIHSGARITGNTANLGGGVYSAATYYPLMKGGQITDNTATTGNGADLVFTQALYLGGDAMPGDTYCPNSTVQITLNNTLDAYSAESPLRLTLSTTACSNYTNASLLSRGTYAPNDVVSTESAKFEVEEDYGYDKYYIASTGKLTKRAVVEFNYNYQGASPAFERGYADRSGLIIPPANPTREGYTFGGWFTATEGGSPINFSEAVSTTITEVYAHWLQTSFYVAPENRGGSDAEGVAGDAAHPFASVTNAFDTIAYNVTTKNLRNYNYEIIVDSTVVGNQQMALNQKFADQSTTITLRGKNGLKDGAPQDTLKGDGNTVLTVANDMPVTIKNLVITDGNSSVGGGIRITNNENENISPKVTLDTVFITGNKSMQADGGGVRVESGKLTMLSGSKISGNTTLTCGGGVWLDVGARLDMLGGEISGNISSYGSDGRGVYMNGVGFITMSGSAKVTGGDDVYLSTGQTIVVGELDKHIGADSIVATISGISSAGITVLGKANGFTGDLPVGRFEVAMFGNSFFAIEEEDNEGKTVEKIAAQFVYYEGSNKRVVETRVFDIDNTKTIGEGPAAPNRTGKTFKGWFETQLSDFGLADTLNTSEVIAETKTFVAVYTDAQTATGDNNRYAIDDALGAADWYSDLTVTVDGTLSAQQVDGNYRLRSITLQGKDTDAKIDGGWRADNANQNVEDYGPALVIQTAVPVTIRNLAITGGYSTTGGGGISCDGGSLTIEDGAKINNNNGCGIVLNNSAFTMTGGEICNNSSVYGAGGIYITGTCPDVMTISGGTISGNTVSSAGGSGGIYFEGDQTSEDKTLSICGTAVISGNHSYYEGGGIRIKYANAVLAISGGTIRDNYCEQEGRAGGAIAAITHSRIIISDSAYIPSGATIDGTFRTGFGFNDVGQNYGAIQIAGKLTPPAACTDGIVADITPRKYENDYELFALAEGVNTTTLAAEMAKFRIVQGGGITFYLKTDGKLSDGYARVDGAYFDGSTAVTGSSVFIAGRKLTIGDLIVSDHEVTQREYEAVMGATPSGFKDEPATGEIQAERAVDSVSWFDAIVFCNKLSIAQKLKPCYKVDDDTLPANWNYNPNTGASISGQVVFDTTANGYRLPTEAEWEYLARGGNLTNSGQTTYSGSNSADSVAWYSGNGGNKTHEVRLKKANALGIYDMSGNVWEWCWDYNNTISSNTPATGPATANQNYHSERGGWFGEAAVYCQVDDRQSNPPYKRDNRSGLRVVRNNVRYATVGGVACADSASTIAAILAADGLTDVILYHGVSKYALGKADTEGTFINAIKTNEHEDARFNLVVAPNANIELSGADCQCMFDDCEELVSADLRGFNTASVTSMIDMFNYCSSLTTLNLSGWNTGNVTYMGYMFGRCEALDTVDVSSFNTANVTNMDRMFYRCSSLTTLNLSGWNTGNVTSMEEMFSNCSALTTLDLSGFKTDSVTIIRSMFKGCSELTTIYAAPGADWNRSGLSSSDMFTGCSKLVGGNGTQCDTSSVKDATRAHIDGGEANPGYFTEPYATVGGRAYFNQRATYTAIRDATADSICVALSGQVSATDLGKAATENTIIYAIANTTASKVSLVVPEGANIALNADCENMFNDCQKLVSADLRGFNTENVSNMSSMFLNCKALTQLDVSNFNTENVTTMYRVFTDCNALTSLDVSNFNTEKVTSMGMMFRGCSKLTTLDLSNFNTAKVTDMSGMFYLCEALTTLDLSNFNTAEVIDMSGMFVSCEALTTLDVSSFNTGKVVNMWQMFYDCKKITTLDVSSFNTENVTTMSSMFYNCLDLTTIYAADGADWNKAGLTSPNMFDVCNSLVGGNGAKCDTSSVKDATRAHIDKDGQPGFFTTKYAVVGGVICTTLDEALDAIGSANDTTEIVLTGAVSAVDLGKAETDGIINAIATNSFDDARFRLVVPESANIVLSGEDCKNMFNNCEKLVSADLRGFNTENVTNMYGMFDECSSLTTLDVSSFNTANVNDMNYMLYGCSKLETIYAAADANWYKESGLTSVDMFDGCESLVGGKGTQCDTSEVKDATYARVDGGSGNPGFFTPNWQVNVGNGHCYVDLGLSSGTMWATTNVGATTPVGYGDYFAWGETETKESYCWNTYIYYNEACDSTADVFPFTKYSTADTLTLLAEDDVAAVKWGGAWSMPDSAQFEELINECYWERTENYYGNGVGYIVYKSKDKNTDKKRTKAEGHVYSAATDVHIFLPAAGDYIYQGVENNTRYWSATHNSRSLRYGSAVGFNYNYLETSNLYRCAGFPVRPVIKP